MKGSIRYANGYRTISPSAADEAAEILPAVIAAEATQDARHLKRQSTSNAVGCTTPVETLSMRLLTPLLDNIKGCDKVLLAPDGPLMLVPFEVLSVGDRLLIDLFEISYLSTGRDVLRFADASTRKPGISVIVADPDFDLSDQIGKAEVPPRDSRIRRQRIFVVGFPTRSGPLRHSQEPAPKETLSQSSYRMRRQDLVRTRSSLTFEP